MQIKLLVDLPYDARHGCTKGKVYDAIPEEGTGCDRILFFVAESGEQCTAWPNEVEVITAWDE